MEATLQPEDMVSICTVSLDNSLRKSHAKQGNFIIIGKISHSQNSVPSYRNEILLQVRWLLVVVVYTGNNIFIIKKSGESQSMTTSLSFCQAMVSIWLSYLRSPHCHRMLGKTQTLFLGSKKQEWRGRKGNKSLATKSGPLAEVFS